MLFGCITSARFNMTAEVRSQGKYTPPTETDKGHWDRVQDEDTGSIRRVWVPTGGGRPEDASTDTFPCTVSTPTGATASSFGIGIHFDNNGKIINTEYLILTCPASRELSKKDKITNIRGSDGNVIWREEEFDGRPTVFTVQGVVPITDPFGTHIENKAILARAEIQDGN